MGLDVYLYTKAEQEQADAHDTRWDTESDRNPHGKPYDQWSEAEKKQYFDEMSALPRSQDVPSEKYPDNINNRRYLRSSYNAGGFNQAVPEVTGNENFSYYGIFEPLGDLEGYAIKVEDQFRIVECRRRAEQCVAALEALQDEYVYRVESVSSQPARGDGPMTDSDALETFHAERQRYLEAKSPFDSWGSALGDFWMGEPLEVMALMPGQDILRRPCVHAIYRTKLHDSYLESAHVLVEFCDELLELVRRDGCAYIHWSA